VLLAELPMGLQGVATDAQHLGVALAKGVKIPLEAISSLRQTGVKSAK